MRYLLDTHVVLWAILDSPRLGPVTREILGNLENRLYFSATCIWEISIKRGRLKHDFLYDPHEIRMRLTENGYEELPIWSQHAAEVGALPPIHKNPFDRLLIAQAMVEGITLLTSDAVVAQYPGPIRKV